MARHSHSPRGYPISRGNGKSFKNISSNLVLVSPDDISFVKWSTYIHFEQCCPALMSIQPNWPISERWSKRTLGFIKGSHTGTTANHGWRCKCVPHFNKTDRDVRNFCPFLGWCMRVSPPSVPFRCVRMTCYLVMFLNRYTTCGASSFSRLFTTKTCLLKIDVRPVLPIFVREFCAVSTGSSIITNVSKRIVRFSESFPPIFTIFAIPPNVTQWVYTCQHIEPPSPALPQMLCWCT